MTDRNVLDEAGFLNLATPCRRDVLKIGGAAAAALMLGACHSVNTGTFPVGAVDSLAVGSARLVEDGPFIVARDEEGLYAMSALCTHMRCTLTVEADRFPCHCHGSVFDLNGQVVEGPARNPLPHYRVTLGDDGISVDTSAEVEASVRTPVEG